MDLTDCISQQDAINGSFHCGQIPQNVTSKLVTYGGRLSILEDGFLVKLNLQTSPPGRHIDIDIILNENP